MRAIIKGPEPASLTAHRKKQHSDYDNYAAKNDLRHALVIEQRGLCCYCMGRIRPLVGSTKIEHWKCQAHHCGEQLNYRNLLGACLGGHGQPARLQHCDTRKGNRDLKWNPAKPAHRIETRLRYELDGSTHACDANFDEQLNQVLNLNLAVLRNNRKGVLDSVLCWWRKQPKPVPRRGIENKRKEYAAKGGDLTPYCQVAVWWLNQKIVRMP